MEPIPSSTAKEENSANTSNDKAQGDAVHYEVIEKHTVKRSDEQNCTSNVVDDSERLQQLPEDEEIEDNEIVTKKPLLQKPSLDNDNQTCKEEESNSRSGSTTVRIDGIVLDVLNCTTIHVDWCPVANSETINGYKIRYAAGDNSSYNEIFVTPGISNYTITGLRPNTEYDISVNAIDDRENVVQTCGWVRQKTDELEDGQANKFETPYLTAAAAIALLLVAVVVPITFLFVRNCGLCATSNEQKEKPALSDQQNEKEKDLIQGSFRHKKEFAENSPAPHVEETEIPPRQDINYKP